MTSAAVWQLHQNRAALVAGGFQGELQLEHLAAGLTTHGPKHSAWSAGLLGVQIPGFADPIESTTIVDRYIRQNDLIATYEILQPEHLRAQVYWRYRTEALDQDSATAGRSAGVHLIVSLQTNRLDLQPTVAVVSQLPLAELLVMPTRDSERFAETDVRDGSPRADRDAQSPLWLVRPSEGDHSVALMTLPSDLTHVEVAVADETSRLRFQLLSERLEKGVIRRAQAAAWLVPRANDTETARRIFREFCTAPPPLTT